MGCCISEVIFVISQSMWCLDHLIDKGAIPDMYSCSISEFFRHPDISQHDSLNAASSLLTRDDLPHNGLAYFTRKT